MVYLLCTFILVPIHTLFFNLIPPDIIPFKYGLFITDETADLTVLTTAVTALTTTVTTVLIIFLTTLFAASKARPITTRIRHIYWIIHTVSKYIMR